jgi:hypothetical protein
MGACLGIPEYRADMWRIGTASTAADFEIGGLDLLENDNNLEAGAICVDVIFERNGRFWEFSRFGIQEK